MAITFGSELFAEDAVIRAIFGEKSADGALRREIGVGHMGAIGLRRDPQIARIEAGEGLRVGDVCQPKGEGEIAREISGCGGVGHTLRIVVVVGGRLPPRFRMTL
jgi:hypothetical protein